MNSHSWSYVIDRTRSAKKGTAPLSVHITISGLVLLVLLF